MRYSAANPWIVFGYDSDTGVYFDGGRLHFALDGTEVDAETFFAGCVLKGHITELTAIAALALYKNLGSRLRRE